MFPLKITIVLLMIIQEIDLYHNSSKGNKQLEFNQEYSQPSEAAYRDFNFNDSDVCPRWSYFQDGDCHCPTNQMFLSCKNTPNVSEVLELLMCSCITCKEYDEDREGALEFGFCIYNCNRWNKNNNPYKPGYHDIPQNISYWNEYECGEFHRTGTLCGSCDEKNGYYQRVYSFDVSCIQCTNSTTEWIKYILSAYLPLTFFCIIVLIFKLNIHSSALQGFVTFCQILSLPTFSRVLFQIFKDNHILFPIVKILGTLFGIWNLDFFRIYYTGYCLQTGTLATLSLDFAIAGYPLLLMILTYKLVSLYDNNFKPLVIVWKPFRWFSMLFSKKWEIRTSAIDSFSAFFFLSNMKFLSTSFDLLVPVKVHQFTDARQVHHVWRLYYDANIPYLQGTHLYYAMLAIMVLIIFVFFPVLLLLLYPFNLCQKCLSILPNRVVLPLHIFVDSFQGCYKNRTEPGTRDCRWFSAVLIIFRFMYLTIYAVSPTQAFIPLSIILVVNVSLAIIIADPFKPEFSNTKLILALCILLFSLSNVPALYIDEAIDTSRNLPSFYFGEFVQPAAVILPIIFTFIFVLWWITSKRKNKCQQNIH